MQMQPDIQLGDVGAGFLTTLLSTKASPGEMEESMGDINESLKNVDINDNQGGNTTQLRYAVIWGRYAECAALIRKGARVDGYDTETGYTTMHYAAESGRADVCELLLTNGAADQLEIPNPEGQTALHIASKRGYIDVAAVLMKYGARVDNVDRRGCTVLYSTEYECTKPSLKSMLVENGASLATKHPDGTTPLDIALVNLGDYFFKEDFDGPNDPSVKLWRTYFNSMACHGIAAPPKFHPELVKLVMEGVCRSTVVGRHRTARSALAAMRSAF